MKKRFPRFYILIPFLLFAFPAGAADIRLMTQNQYLGADLAAIVAAPNADAFNAAVVAALQTVAANIPTERMKALAADIAKEQPALVGLQEVYQFQCTDLVEPAESGTGCSDPSIAASFSDHLQATLDALDGEYTVKATVVNLSIAGVPFLINGVPALVSLVDRDVILARNGVDAAPVDYTAFQSFGICLKPSADGCNYSVVIEANSALGPISL